MDVQNIIIDLSQLVEEAEKLKGYWDDTGLDMCIAVVPNKTVVISTKHWFRVNYINTQFEPIEIWKNLYKVSQDVGRKLIKSTKDNYVYIHKLNETQTKDIFNRIVSVMDCDNKDIVRVWEFNWEIDNAIRPN